MYVETLDFQHCQLVSISKILTANLLQKNWFSGWVFYVSIADADFESLKSLHTLFYKYLEYLLVKYEQNRMVRTI